MITKKEREILVKNKTIPALTGILGTAQSRKQALKYEVMK